MYRISEKDLKNIFSIQPVTEGDAVHSRVSYFDSRPAKVLPLRPRSLLQRLARLHCVDFRRISRAAAEFNGISYSPLVFLNPNDVFLPIRCVAGEDGRCRIEYYNLAHHFGDYDMRPAEDRRTSYLLYRHKPGSFLLAPQDPLQPARPRVELLQSVDAERVRAEALRNPSNKKIPPQKQGNFFVPRRLSM